MFEKSAPFTSNDSLLEKRRKKPSGNQLTLHYLEKLALYGD